MRIGLNPQKHQKHQDEGYFHQVVVPIYLPNEEGYYKDGFRILNLCLDSLFKTSHPGTFFTLVDNGSSKKVANFIDELFAQGKVQEVIHTANVGKVNASYKGVTGHAFPIVTIVDADVMFLNGWQKATYEIFNTFPKTGFVSQVPLPKLYRYNTYPIIIKYLFSKKLWFRPVKDPEALTNFAVSIENPSFYNKFHLEKVLTLEENGVRAVLGTGHFLATFRGPSIRDAANGYCDFKMGGKADRTYLDTPIMRKGEWRLSTDKNYAYHLGNTFEPWMEKVAATLKEDRERQPPVVLKNIAKPGIGLLFKRALFSKVLGKGFLWKQFLKRKGLSKEAAKQY